MRGTVAFAAVLVAMLAVTANAQGLGCNTAAYTAQCAPICNSIYAVPGTLCTVYQKCLQCMVAVGCPEISVKAQETACLNYVHCPVINVSCSPST